MKRIVRGLSCFLLAALISACGALATSRVQRDQALTDYGVAIRWSEFDQALEFVDPHLREQQPLSDLERERLKQIQVTGYEVKTKVVAPEGDIEQTVEIRLISKNTQRERIITDHQHWHWDALAKQYWLGSGLPDFSAQ